MWNIIILLLIGILSSFLSGNFWILIIGLIILGIIAVLPDPLDFLEYPLFLLYVIVVGMALIKGTVEFSVEAITGMFLEIGNTIICSFLENPLAFGLGFLVFCGLIAIGIYFWRKSKPEVSIPVKFQPIGLKKQIKQEAPVFYGYVKKMGSYFKKGGKKK